MKTPTTLIILDGFGLSDSIPGNAVLAANTPILDSLTRKYPHSRLSASGSDVGLPVGTMGNSEVGHINIGAGRIVYQNYLRISNAIADASFYDNPVYLSAIRSSIQNNRTPHIFILLSDAGVHSHDSHLQAMLNLLHKHGLNEVFIHCFMDGRDTSPTSGISYIQKCLDFCASFPNTKIASLIGRFYAMDRDKRWDRIERAYNALVFGDAKASGDPLAAVRESYDAGITDEFIEPIICADNSRIKPGDTIFFLNFRPDRARQLTRAFTDPDFNAFKRRSGRINDLLFVCATDYDSDLTNVSVAFPPQYPKNTFGEYISRLGMSQLRIAETEKYAHVTFFFNGGIEAPFPAEDRILIPSSKEFQTYDFIPEMKAPEVCEAVCNAIDDGKYDVIVVNFANCDMVGHTGNFDAVVKAVETVDACVGRVVEATANAGGISIVTADHGNAELMTADDGASPHTAHTTNPVPFFICGADVKLNDGRLCDITPTMLDLMGLELPPDMSGKSLIRD